jgi:hypothetical protein
LRFLELHTGDDITRVCFSNFVELFPLHHVQRAETFTDSARGVERIRIRSQMATDDLEDVYATRERIGDCSEAVS